MALMMGAVDDVAAEFNTLREQAQQHAEDVRLLELQRFDGMTEALWPDVQKGGARS